MGSGQAGGSKTPSASPAARRAQPMPPIDIFEALLQRPFHMQRLWMLSNSALPWAVQQGRLLQVLIAAHCPQLFKHLIGVGVAPELFYFWWLQGLLTNVLEGPVLLRIWDQFILERSYKVFL